jgi:SAM-dependent methyltransferase
VSGMTISEDGIVTGNTYDKYGSGNPVVRRLMSGFERDLDELFELAAPASVLDVGCGEGVLVHRWALRLGARNPAGADGTAGADGADGAADADGGADADGAADADGRGRVVGIDLEEESIQAGWARHQAPNLEYRVMEVGRASGPRPGRRGSRSDQAASLPFADGEFELASAIEVLEHVPDPEHTLSEMARCASRHLLVSVPHEPLWRMLNMARGAYWTALGNTPGHLNHWSRRSFVELLSRHGEVAEVRSPFPWTMLLVRV